jgi:predicted enzyme related to lactoylglutathione lyase
MMRPITTTLIQTTDLSRTKTFYGKFLGIEFDERATGSAIGALGDAVFVLLESSQPGTTTKVIFAVEDREAAENALRDAGGDVSEQRGELPVGDTVLASDPDGQVIELVHLSPDARALLDGAAAANSDSA